MNRFRYDATPNTLDDGDVTEPLCDATGNLKVTGGGGANDAMTSAQFLANSRSTLTNTTVASQATAITLLADNVNRKGVTITNTDANKLYIILSGETPSATLCNKVIATEETYTVPFGYTGLIRGIWAADGVGQAVIAEFV